MIVKSIASIFFKGLVAIVPLAVTIYAVVWLILMAETGLSYLIPDKWYIPGMGMVMGLVAVFLVGLLVDAWIGRVILGATDTLLVRVPLIKTIYGATKDLLGFFISNKEKQPQKVVVISIPGNPPMRLLGFITRDQFDDIPPGLGEQGMVAVYLPMSYQIGGYTIVVPRDSVQPIDMTTEDALRYAVTAGMTTKK